jgi:hypothetical protein
VPNPNWTISPYYSQGFFSTISEFSCAPDGSLYVQGKVGVASDRLRSESWARGIWMVEPDGKILPVEVFPDSSYMRGGKHSCTVKTCDLPPHPPRERALAVGSSDWVQDKQGNVWGIRENDPQKPSQKACFITRFNVDGSDTVIQSHQDLCDVPKGHNADFTSEPKQIVYDGARDEVVVSVGRFGGNKLGSLALLRINQAGQVTEVLRNWAHAEPKQGDYGYLPNPPGKTRAASNQVRERWSHIEGLIYHRASGNVRFEVSVFSERGYPGRSYEIGESFRTLKRLPYNSPGQSERIEVFGQDAQRNLLFFGDDQKLVDDGTNFSLAPWIFGRRPC